MNNFDGDFIKFDKKVKNEESKSLALYLTFHITIYILILFFAIFFTWYTVFVCTHKYYKVSGASMKNTFNSSIADNDSQTVVDGVYVDCSANLEIFDVVVVDWRKEAIIKRLLAAEGDYISIVAGKTSSGEDCFYFCRIASGSDLSNFEDETAIVDEVSDVNGYTIKSQQEWFDKVGKTIEMNVGTNSNAYEKWFFDSFLAGYWNGSSVYEYFVSDAGVVYVKVPEGKYFCMGDNRAHSNDSRRDVGFVSQSQIVGAVEIVVYNESFTVRLWEVVKYYFGKVEEFFAR